MMWTSDGSSRSCSPTARRQKIYTPLLRRTLQFHLATISAMCGCKLDVSQKDDRALQQTQYVSPRGLGEAHCRAKQGPLRDTHDDTVRTKGGPCCRCAADGVDIRQAPRPSARCVAIIRPQWAVPGVERRSQPSICASAA